MKINNKSILLLFVLIFLFFRGCTFSNKKHSNEDDEKNYTEGIVDTYYSEDIIIADKVIKTDNTGTEDVSDYIQLILDECGREGGGTVFLPRGKYRLTKNISIPSFVYLVGDYQDPDYIYFDGNYGTVILADVAPAKKEVRSRYLADKADPYSNFPALITIGGSAGAIGLTVYYPNQDDENIIPYPFTFEIPSFAGKGGSINHMAQTIKNVTLINSYKGICVSVTPDKNGYSAANEIIHLENIKGTTLYQGIQLYNSSEVGIVRNITFNNTYWYCAPNEYNPGDLTLLNQFTYTYGIGMLLGDVEWMTFNNIHLEFYKIGIRIYDGLRRYISGQPEIYFIGQFSNLKIKNTMTALRVDNLFPDFGMTVVDSILEGTKFAINRTDQTTSRIRLLGTQLTGDIRGKNIYKSAGELEYEEWKAKNKFSLESMPIKPPKKVLYDVVKKYQADKTGKIDSAKSIQKALDDAQHNGGGIVYLPAGYYLINTPLTIYPNTQLRGAAASNTRDQNGLSKGTMIFCNTGFTETLEKAYSEQAAVNISGDNSGIMGIRFIYPQNCPYPINKNNLGYRFHSYTIRAKGNWNYVMNCGFVGVCLGIEFTGMNNAQIHNGLISGIYGCFYNNGINIKNVENMQIDEVVSNGVGVSRIGLAGENYIDWPTDQNVRNIYDFITRPNSVFIQAENSFIQIISAFTYGSKAYYAAKNCESILFNVSGDNLEVGGGKMLSINGGSLYAVNVLRYQGLALESVNNAEVNILNRLSLHYVVDCDVINNVEKENILINEDYSNESESDIPEIYHYQRIDYE